MRALLEPLIGKSGSISMLVSRIGPIAFPVAENKKLTGVEIRPDGLIVAIQPESAFIADARDCPLTRGALAGGWAWCGRRSAAVLWGRGCGREPGAVGE